MDLLVSTKVTSQMAGTVDTVIVTAKAQDAPEVTTSVVDRVYVGHALYMPTVGRDAN